MRFRVVEILIVGRSGDDSLATASHDRFSRGSSRWKNSERSLRFGDSQAYSDSECYPSDTAKPRLGICRRVPPFVNGLETKAAIETGKEGVVRSRRLKGEISRRLQR